MESADTFMPMGAYNSELNSWECCYWFKGGGGGSAVSPSWSRLPHLVHYELREPETGRLSQLRLPLKLSTGEGVDGAELELRDSGKKLRARVSHRS